jgi:hypothetical protein
MGKRGGSASSPSMLSNGGGIAGSGVFGMIGTTIQCKSTDDSMYCNIMKLFNLLVVIIAVLFIMYVVYNLVSMVVKKRK